MPKTPFGLLTAFFVANLAGMAHAAAPRPAPACAPDSPALQALDQILRAYERGDALFLQERLAPDLPGLGAVFEAVTHRRLNARDTRIHLTERQTQCGPDVAVIDFAWEKRGLTGANLTPRVERGRSAFLFSGLGQGLTGPWRVSAVTGDNLFLGGAGAAGILRANPAAASYAGVPVGCVVTSSVTAATMLPPTGTASVDAGGACSVSPVSFACDLSGPGIVPTSVGTGATPACTATTMFTPTPATGSVSYAMTGGTVSVSGPPGGTVSVSVPYTLTAVPNPTMVGPWSVTSSGAGMCTATVTLLTSPLTCTPAPGTVPVRVELFDPDLSGATVPVQVTASNGDSETLNFLRVEAGRYRLNTLPVLRGVGAVSPGNGRIDLPGLAPGTVVLTFSYLDTEPGAGAPPVSRTATLTLTP